MYWLYVQMYKAGKENWTAVLLRESRKNQSRYSHQKDMDPQRKEEWTQDLEAWNYRDTMCWEMWWLDDDFHAWCTGPGRKAPVTVAQAAGSVRTGRRLSSCVWRREQGHEEKRVGAPVQAAGRHMTHLSSKLSGLVLGSQSSPVVFCCLSLAGSGTIIQVVASSWLCLIDPPFSSTLPSLLLSCRFPFSSLVLYSIWDSSRAVDINTLTAATSL